MVNLDLTISVEKVNRGEDTVPQTSTIFVFYLQQEIATHLSLPSKSLLFNLFSLL